ncbi:MAG: Spy/CpxP family protein refolding chaperone [Myxococcota bacterium]
MKTILSRTLVIGGLLLTTAAGLAATTAIAAPGAHRSPVARLMAVADDIGLTDAQKQQIQGVVDTSKPKMKALRQEGRETKKALANAIESGADNDTIAGFAIDGYELRQEGKALRKQARKDIAALLTPEQKAQLKQMREARQAERGGEGKRGRRGPR